VATQQLVTELSDRLAGVEEQVTRALAAEADGAGPSPDTLHELADRVARLRLALDVLRPE
jgi:hypothetical protein